MSLYKRGNVWWSKLYRDGRPVYQSTGIAVAQDGVDGATLKREAQRKDKAWAGEIAKGSFLPQADRVTYDELVEDLKQHYATTGSRNLVEVAKRLAHLTPFFRGMRAARIDASTVAGYVEHRQREDAANGTINRELGILCRIFRLAVTRKRVAAPLILGEKPKEAAPRAGFFEPEQFQAVRKHLSEDLQVAATVAYTYGWRTQSEVLTLERRQLDLEAETLRLDPGQTKNEDGRLVYLTPELKALLGAQVDRVKALEKKLGRVIPYLFPHLGRKGGHLNPRLVGTPKADFRKAWVTACKRAGVPGALRHDCRRTAVRNMVNEGVPERVAMKVTGHRTRSVFDRYHIVSPADLREASRKLAQARR
jgi:integrase